MKFVYILVILTTCLTVKCDDESKLLSFVQIFRHGARTPVLFYKEDPYKDSTYWSGLKNGQLTEEGKQQLVKLGQYIRQRYADFIPKNYSENFLSVTSVTTKRNKQSADSYLKGLFSEQEDFSNAIHIDNSVLRRFIQPTYILQYLKLVKTEKTFTNFIKKHEKCLKYLKNQATIPIPERLFYTYFVWDTLSIEGRKNLTLPEWTKSVFPEDVTDITRMFSKTMCYNKAMQKIVAGPFMNLVTEHFTKVVDQSTNQRVFLYSGHDVNLMCLLNTFGIFDLFNYDVPAFASSIIFELRKNSEKTFVNGYYKVDENLHPITFRGCQFDCDYDEFKKLFSEISLDDSTSVNKNQISVWMSALAEAFT
nr:unnamed protein product [Callosobruchus chinensis]